MYELKAELLDNQDAFTTLVKDIKPQMKLGRTTGLEICVGS